jgi:hypothetical protein
MNKLLTRTNIIIASVGAVVLAAAAVVLKTLLSKEKAPEVTVTYDEETGTTTTEF